MIELVCQPSDIGRVKVLSYLGKRPPFVLFLVRLNRLGPNDSVYIVFPIGVRKVIACGIQGGDAFST